MSRMRPSLWKSATRRGLLPLRAAHPQRSLHALSRSSPTRLSPSPPSSNSLRPATIHVPHHRWQSTQAASASGSSRPSSSFHFEQLLSPASASFPIVKPTYDRSRLRQGIVQFGVGGFHRAHLAYYVDCLLHLEGGEEEGVRWGICGVGVREQDRRISDAMKAQSCYYSLLARGTTDAQTEIRIVGSILDYLFAPDEPARVLQRLLSPDTRIVSLTITESGYDLAHNPEVQHDIDHYNDFLAHIDKAGGGGDAEAAYPKSVFGWILLGLDARRRRGMPAYTVLSCDNLLHNGRVTKESLIACADAAGQKELSEYVTSQVSSPNSMVDRITPVTQSRDVEFVKEKYGILDQWPIMTEAWTQWVVEEKDSSSFPLGKPSLHLLKGDQYNVLVVSDVNPYEAMKLRLLNASHSAICYLGYLCGNTYIHEIMADPDFTSYARRFMDDEVTPGLPAVPNIDLAEYKRKIVERFANPNVRDTALRVCMDGSAKWPKFLLPSLRYQLESNAHSAEAVHFSSLVLAAWFRFLSGENDEGQAIPISDPLAVKLGLTELAKTTRGDARQMFQAARPIFQELSDNELLIGHVQKALTMLYEHRAKDTLRMWQQELPERAK